MNHYRFRLVLATASLTAALTVLSLKLGGFLSPASSDSIVLTASNRIDSQSVSPYKLACQHQLAMLVHPQQHSTAPHPLLFHRASELTYLSHSLS